MHDIDKLADDNLKILVLVAILIFNRNPLAPHPEPEQKSRLDDITRFETDAFEVSTKKHIPPATIHFTCWQCIVKLIAEDTEKMAFVAILENKTPPNIIILVSKLMPAILRQDNRMFKVEVFKTETFDIVAR